MNENRKRVSTVSKIRILAAAALSVAIIGSQVPVVRASDTSVIQKIHNSIPENVTVENPVSLSEIKLPDSEYGTLEWTDGSFVPDRRVQSCEAILKPADGVDLSDMEDWDEEIGGVICHIRVVVSSIESSGEYDALDDYSEETFDTSETDDGDIDAVSEETDNPDGISETESADESSEEETTGDAVENVLADIEEDNENTNADAAPGDNAQEDSSGRNTAEDVSVDAEAEASVDNEASSEDGQACLEEDIEDSSEGNVQDEDSGQAESPLEGDTSDLPVEQPEPVENIFDNPADFTIEDDRPVQAEDDLTEEEQAERAMINHSCNGIFVSGINLPWYVQFRVSSGESYEFSNESEASIFQSYEFELWDLQNNTEYEIPDGEYISVTIPVKEGYDYIIEHLLDNGATETIIPSVEGGTMVFSTHSFSPFGIAGSKQLVGPDFGLDISITPTPTPTVTPTAKPSQIPGGSSGNGTGATSGGSTANGSGNNNPASGGNASGDTAVSGNNSSTGLAGSDGSSTGNTSQTYSDSGSGSTQGSTDASEGSNNSGSNTQSTGNQSAAKDKAVATGDTTQILPFVVLIVAAVVIIGAVLFIRKKKK